MSGERRQRVRILIADSQPVAAQECKALLKPEFDIVGTASNGSRLVRSASRLKPDIVIAETQMPGKSGFEAGDEIKRQNRATKLIYMSSSPDPDVAAQAFQHGGSGYLVKACAAKELTHAVKCIARGESYLCSAVTQSTIDLLILLANERNRKRAARRHREKSPASPTHMQSSE